MDRGSTGRLVLSANSIPNGVAHHHGLLDNIQLADILRKKISKLVQEEIAKCVEKRDIESELTKIRDSNRQLESTLNQLERRLETVQASRQRISANCTTSVSSTNRVAPSAPVTSIAATVSESNVRIINGQSSNVAEKHVEKQPDKTSQKRKILFDASYGDQKRFAVHVGPRPAVSPTPTTQTSKLNTDSAITAPRTSINPKTNGKLAQRNGTSVVAASNATRRFLVRTTVDGEDACYKLEIAGDMHAKPLTAEAVVRLLLENGTRIGETADVRELVEEELTSSGNSDAAPVRNKTPSGSQLLATTNHTAQPVAHKQNGCGNNDIANLFEKVLNDFDGIDDSQFPTPATEMQPQAQPSDNVFERLLDDPNGLRRPSQINGVGRDHDLDIKTNAPPRAVLKIDRRGATEAALTWDLVELSAPSSFAPNGYRKTRYDHTKLSVFEIYACLDDSGLGTLMKPESPNTSLAVPGSKWQQLARVSALPLPMACTLSQFQTGRRYYLAIRARDRLDRAGPFSDVVVADFACA